MRPMRIEVEESWLESENGFWVWRDAGCHATDAWPSQVALANLLQEARQLLDRIQQGSDSRPKTCPTRYHGQFNWEIYAFLEKTGAPKTVVPEVPMVEDVLVRRIDAVDKILQSHADRINGIQAHTKLLMDALNRLQSEFEDSLKKAGLR